MGRGTWGEGGVGSAGPEGRTADPWACRQGVAARFWSIKLAALGILKFNVVIPANL